MLILLSGPESYLRTQKLRAIEDEFIKKHPEAAEARFAFNEEPKEQFAKLKEFAAHQTLFDTMKLGIVTGLCAEAAGKTSECKKLLQLLAENKEITLLLNEEKTPGKEFSFLKVPAVRAQEFDYLSDAEWAVFVKYEADARRMKLDAPVMALMKEKFQKDLWAFMQEIEKLSLLGVSHVTLPVCAAIGLTREADFMGLLRNIVFGALPLKLAALEELYAKKEDAAKIFNITAYQKKDALPQFAEYDVAVKSGKLEYEEALLDWILL